MQVDYFLKLDGIPGESQDATHKEEISLLSWSWGEHQDGTAGHGPGLGAGKVAFKDLRVVMRVDKASPKLLLACSTGQHINKATLTCRKAGKDAQDYLVLLLHEILVSSYDISGEGQHADNLPVVHVTLHFNRIEQKYREQAADGTVGKEVRAGYDRATNRAL
jgi:type VI secretion system secreted protein Hcp